MAEGNAYMAIWRAKLMRMWMDAQGRTSPEVCYPSARERERRALTARARRWFGSAEFEAVCLAADIDPDWALRQYRAGHRPNPHLLAGRRR